jgi:hypothetical protein
VLGDLGVRLERAVHLPEVLRVAIAEGRDGLPQPIELGAHLPLDLLEMGPDDVLLGGQVRSAGLHLGADLLSGEHRELVHRCLTVADRLLLEDPHRLAERVLERGELLRRPVDHRWRRRGSRPPQHAHSRQRAEGRGQRSGEDDEEDAHAEQLDRTL